MKRAILIITDSMGVGEAPDAAKFGDLGANTFVHSMENTEGFAVPNLQKLGIGYVNGDGDLDATADLADVAGAQSKGSMASLATLKIPHSEIIGCYGRMQEISSGKDTTTGHWEIAGLETKVPFKTYPNGFPPEFIAEFEKQIGIEVLGNYPASGTAIIEELGPEHESTGKPIIYTSADSVLQIAANTAVIPLERLYEICRIARTLLQGDWACGRVIARPYIIRDGKRIRTSDRRDYSVTPPADTLLDRVCASGQKVHAIGKISDIFNAKGISDSVHTVSNMDGMDKTIETIRDGEGGFIFTNLVDFDSLYGHRRDAAGYGKAIMDFDSRLPEVFDAMKPGDILFISADHGNDPVHAGTDHTREYVPLLVYGPGVKAGVYLGTRKTFADLGQTIADYLGTEPLAIGESFLSDIL